tara:strand:- start:615 stop:1328 length:714 start_codon:yes stop_codon:yes gene_type:complete
MFKKNGILVNFGILLIFLGFFPVIHGIKNGLKLNELGDYIGGSTGSIWALSGIIFVYAAFKSQQEDLHNTINRANKQDFELLLFKMLELHNNRIHNFDIDSTGGKIEGVDCFRKFWLKIQYLYENSEEVDEKNKVENVLNEIETLFDDDIPLYINSLNGILDHINQGTRDTMGMDPTKYYKLLYHQLSRFEILIVYLYSSVYSEYECLFFEESFQKLKILIKNENIEIKTLKNLVID